MITFGVTSVSLALLVGVIALAVWYDWWKHQYFQKRGFAYVKNYIPLFGNTLQWRVGIHLALTNYVKTYGKVVGMYDLHRPVLVISDAEILKEILVKNFTSFANRRRFPLSQEPLSKGISTLQDKDWKEVRTVITPSFSASKLKRMALVINDCCDMLVDNINKCNSEGKSIECRDIFGGFSMDAVARCGFGLKVSSQEDSDDPFIENAKKVFKFSVMTPAFMLSTLIPPLEPIFCYFKYNIFDSKAIAFFTKVTEDAIKLRDQKGAFEPETIDFLQLMLNAHEDKEHFDNGDAGSSNGKVHRRKLTSMEVMAQGVTFFIAGYETTNTNLSLTAYLLATNLDVQDRLIAEIDDMAPTRDLACYETISKMEYLDMVFNESFRMYPPAAIFDRMCNETTTIGDLTLEKGLSIMVCSWAIHYDEDYWPEPTKFDPERFSPENKASIKPCTFVPFGFGPRNCIAMRFALLEAKMAMVRVLQNYRLEVSSETKIPPTLGKMGFLSPESVKLNFSPRK